MSEIRRSLMMQKEETTSWYRICPGGIYTTTNAYIDTGYKNFMNNNFEYYIDSKVLIESDVNRWMFGATANGAFNSVVFSGKNDTTLSGNTFRTSRNKTHSNLANFDSLKPFINKKVRITVPINQSGNNAYIQVYSDNVLGPKVYTNYDYFERQYYTCTCPVFIFTENRLGSPNEPRANDIVIYKSEAKQSSIVVFSMISCQLTQNILAELAWDNKPHNKGEYGMYNEVDGKFYGNANSTGYFIENFD